MYIPILLDLFVHFRYLYKNTSDFLLKMLQKFIEGVLPSPMQLPIQARQISTPIYVGRAGMVKLKLKGEGGAN